MKDLLEFRTFVLVRKGIHQINFFHAPALIALCNEKTTDRAAKRLRSFKYIPPPFEVPAPDDFSHQQAGAHFFPEKV